MDTCGVREWIGSSRCICDRENGHEGDHWDKNSQITWIDGATEGKAWPRGVDPFAPNAYGAFTVR